MTNTTITAATRCNGGSLWARYRARTAGMLIIICAALMALPGLAKAQQKLGCTASSGAKIQLIPSVNFTLGTLPPPGTEIYRTQTYVINYECSFFDASGKPVGGVPLLQVLADYSTLNRSLNAAGLKLQIIVNGDESNPWEPNLQPGFPISENHDAGPAYSGSSGPRALTLIARLLVINDHPPAARYPVPGGTIFKLIATYGAGSSPGPFITNTPTRMQFTPKCIGNVSVDDLVQFKSVLAMTGNQANLPQQLPFNVTARVNPACNLGSLTAPMVPDNANTRFLMWLSAQFVMQGPGRIGDGGTSIILNNEDGVENGLKLQILDTSKANQPVEILPALVPPLYQDAGNFGQLMGDHPAAAVHTYTASLTSDPGKELKLGKYSAQVLVRVSYY